MTFRFLHTADIHLDSPLRSLALRDPEIAETVGNATRQAFVRTVDLCLEEKVDALMIAGDLYDGDLRSMKTAIFFGAQMRRLDEAGIRVFIVRGNHDAESRITKQLSLPPNVHVFSGRAEAIEIEGKGVVVHGVSFADPQAPESLLPKFKAPLPGQVNIGLLHTSLSGAEGHDTYAPCSLTDLFDHGFDYWALGHIHKRQVASAGSRRAVMPGIPQGRHVGEAGPKSVTLVSVGDDGDIALEERLVAVAAFSLVPVDTAGMADWSDVLAAMEAALRQARGEVAAEHLVARIELTGATALAGRLRRDADLLLDEARQVAAAMARTAVEKVSVQVEAPVVAVEAEGGNPLVDLRRLVADELRHSESFHAEVRSLVAVLRKDLPPELRDSLLSDWSDAAADDDDESWLQRLIEAGGSDVLARLEGRGRED